MFDLICNLVGIMPGVCNAIGSTNLTGVMKISSAHPVSMILLYIRNSEDLSIWIPAYREILMQFYDCQYHEG